MVNEKYQTESIYIQNKKYVKNGVAHSITSWTKDLKKEMEVSPDAVMEYSKFQRQRKVAFILSTVGFVSVVSSFYVSDEIQNYFFLGGLTVGIVSIPLYRTAGKSLNKAIWLRNGAILN